jgi:Arc/MetJ-type ribon-helix-helix transcriptional regulator
MVRVNITFDRETLRLATREARRRRISRSEFIRSAVRKDAGEGQREAEEAVIRTKRREAFAQIRKIAAKLGDWPAEQILHDWRYRHKKVAR